MATQTDNYRRHTHRNPIQKFLIWNFTRIFLKRAKKLRPQTVLDAGCGEGVFLWKLKQAGIGKKIEGIEYSQEAIAIAKKNHPTLSIKQGDIYKLPYPSNSFDLVICIEVLEHLEYPEKALSELERVSKKHCIISVPNEPLFMIANFIRGKNWSRWGNDIEHINHWSFVSFRKFVSKYLTVQKLSIPPFYTLVVARKKRSGKV